MQRAQPTISQPWNVEIQRRPDELCGDKNANQHADDAPNDRHDRKLSYDIAVICARVDVHNIDSRLIHRTNPGSKPNSHSVTVDAKTATSATKHAANIALAIRNACSRESFITIRVPEYSR